MLSMPKPGAVIFAKNAENIADFYEQLFGLMVKHREQDKVVLESESFILVIHAIPSHIAENIHIKSPPKKREDTPIKLFLPVVSISDARITASSLGGGLLSADAEWSMAGFRACDGYDPEGNVFQVRESVS